MSYILHVAVTHSGEKTASGARMNPGEVDRDELDARLSELHAASFGWACACCRWNEMDAEDVLQTTYLKVISGKARFSGRSSFRTWLFGVIRFTAHERTRRLSVQSEGEGRLMIEAATTDATSSGPVERVVGCLDVSDPRGAAV